ncbi:cellulose biosynthesis protein BcsN [Mesorhizobium sp. SB112]|uniref:cellulose biosynthesis protein BcsN n=1 Tax=Mesorhizobium sp. SB112 TaxID=3151853 RepID=UPI003265288F
MNHIVLLGLSGALLAACATREGVEISSTLHSTTAESAFVLPPPGGPSIVSVIERRYSNATQQDIAVATNAATSGQNLIRVQFFGPVNRAAAGDTALPDTALRDGNLAAEMRAQLPGIRMQQSPYYVQNRYGPFGYSVGRSSADLCLYAWQRIRAGKGKTSITSNRGSIQIRLRICEAGATEQKLLGFMYGFSINASFDDESWNPYGQPASPPDTLGVPGTPVYPVGGTSFETVTMPVAVATAPARQRTPPPQAGSSARAPEPLPQPIGPAVPPPPNAVSPGNNPVVPAPPCPAGEGGQNADCN